MRGNSFFAVYERKTNMELTKHRYSDISDRQKSKLKERLDKKEIVLYCCCDKKVEQRIRSNTLAVYNATKNAEHQEFCCKNKQYESTGHYVSGIKKNGDIFEAHVAGLYTNNKSPEANIESIANPGTSYSSGRTSQGETTLFGLGRLLNLMAWEHAVMKEERLIQNRSDMLKKVYGQCNKFHLYVSPKKKKSLNELIYDPKKSLRRGETSFIYMEVDSVYKKVYKTKTVHFMRTKNSFGSQFTFYINLDDYNKELLKERGHSLIYFVFGVVEKTSDKGDILTLKNFALIPVTEQGLYVESSNEKMAYEFFCEHKRLFYKPYEEVPEYNFKIPDVMFIYNEKRIIGEIFGMETEEYVISRTEKLKTAEEIKELYGFWKWDVRKEELSLPF